MEGRGNGKRRSRPLYIVECQYKRRPGEKDEWAMSTVRHGFTNPIAAHQHWAHFTMLSGSNMEFQIRKTRRSGLMALDYFRPAGPER